MCLTSVGLFVHKLWAFLKHFICNQIFTELRPIKDFIYCSKADGDDDDVSNDGDDNYDGDDYINSYLIFVIFFTQPQFEVLKSDTWKCIYLQQKLPRDKTA